MAVIVVVVSVMVNVMDDWKDNVVVGNEMVMVLVLGG